jgi:hypothetical protein
MVALLLEQLLGFCRCRNAYGRYGKELRMRIGVPREIKDNEFRAGLTPSSVGELIHAGHEALVERGAGVDAENIIRIEKLGCGTDI